MNQHNLLAKLMANTIIMRVFKIRWLHSKENKQEKEKENKKEEEKEDVIKAVKTKIMELRAGK